MTVRLLVAGSVAIATATVLAIWGIGLTSALIELVVFAGGLAAWVVAGRGPGGSGEGAGDEARAEGVLSLGGSVRIRQRARSVLARFIGARHDIEIDQHDRRGH
jgi:hypothetical protein